METLSLVCPICCNETFDSRDALKYHLLSFVDNITCPACHARCDDIWDLTEHLGRECKDKPEPPPVVMPPPKKIKVEPPESGGEIEQVFLKSDFQEQEKSSLENHVEETPKGQNESHEDESQNLMYTCQMCNISFDSIEDHLAKYHEGEEVILETENDEDAPPNTEDGHEDNNSAYEDFQNEGDEDYDETSSQTTQRTVDEEQCYDKSGSAYTRKVVKIDKFWDNVNDSGAKVPLTEKYLLTNGKIRKISEKEAESVEDKSQIIEIHQCSRCALQFPNISHFNNHKCDVRSAKTPGKVKYKCSDCSEAYPSLVDLNDHMKSHIQTDPSGKLKKTITMGPQVCDICNTMFPSYKSLRLHKRMHEPVKSKEIEAPVQYNILGHKDDDDDGDPFQKHEQGQARPKRAPRYVCCVNGCTSRTETTNVSMFRFPKDENRCKIWASFCNLQHLYDENFPDQLHYSRKRVCGLHFEPRDFLTHTKNRLEHYACPSILPDVEDSGELYS